MSVYALREFFKRNESADIFISLLQHRNKLSPDQVSIVLISLITAEYLQEYQNMDVADPRACQGIEDSLRDFFLYSKLVEPDRLEEAVAKTKGSIIDLVVLLRVAKLARVPAPEADGQTEAPPADVAVEADASSAAPAAPVGS